MLCVANCNLKQLLWGSQELSLLILLGSLGNALHFAGTLKNTFYHSCAEQHLREFFFAILFSIPVWTLIA